MYVAECGANLAELRARLVAKTCLKYFRIVSPEVTARPDRGHSAMEQLASLTRCATLPSLSCVDKVRFKGARGVLGVAGP